MFYCSNIICHVYMSTGDGTRGGVSGDGKESMRVERGGFQLMTMREDKHEQCLDTNYKSGSFLLKFRP